MVSLGMPTLFNPEAFKSSRDIPEGFYSYSPPVGLGAPPRVDHAHPNWVCSCGRAYSAHEHICSYCGRRHDYGDMISDIPIQAQRVLPQPVLDSMEDDGPLSVAYQINPHLIGIRPKYPAPATGQYPYRYDARKLEDWGMIKSHEEIQGYAQASIDADAGSGISQDDLKKLHLDQREDRLVFMVISGWALLMWRSEEDYQRGQYGGRNAPRPLGWWDMRKAHDVAVEMGTDELDKCPHKIAVLTGEGVVYFRVPYEEDVHIWFNGLRGLIRDYNYNFIKSRDTKHHQQKRWPCAIGVAECLQRGLPIGERAMASAFHCYDIDYNCVLGVGELMILIEEIEAGIRHNQGFAEAKDRDSALESADSKFEGGLTDIFNRAMTFRNSCDRDGNGQVRKDEFMLNGQSLMAQALGFAPSGGHIGNSGDICYTQ